MNSLQHHYGVTDEELSTPNWSMGGQHHIGAIGRMALENNIAAFREAKGWSRPELARRMGTSAQQVERLEKGQRGLKHEWIEKAARALGVPQADIITQGASERAAHEARSDHPPVRGSADGDGAIALRRINLGFAMGDGSNLDDYIEEGTMDFDPNLLRTISQAPAHRLLVANGVGDSMQPTLFDSDMLVIDTLQTRLNMSDRIWAIALFGAGAVKRLRPAADGKVEVISDNPMHEKQVVEARDVRIVGRVVWSGRRH
ncbi:XRE family transcriptional regulator [Sphingobium sp.]|uniref:XRE family transcriptional regulator n=1 Tax=Sphingobium sp. TaxID=1912891 RepID=UPI003BB79726